MQPMRFPLPHPGLWPRQVLIGLVQAYRWTLKPWLGNACRFEPSCSAYALQALRQHGARRGAALSGWRLMRCHPWCAGGLDPVPEPRNDRRQRGLFTGLFGKQPPPPPGSTSHSHAPLTGELP